MWCRVVTRTVYTNLLPCPPCTRLSCQMSVSGWQRALSRKGEVVADAAADAAPPATALRLQLTIHSPTKYIDYKYKIYRYS